MLLYNDERTDTIKAIDTRRLVSSELFDKLTARLAWDDGVSTEMAERMMDQTLAFLVTAARHPGAKLAPPTEVDAGWHLFIIHTRDYAKFCQDVAGRFIHHQPADGLMDGGEAIQRTAQLMRDAGMPVDEEFWRPEGSGCHNACHMDCDSAV